MRWSFKTLEKSIFIGVLALSLGGCSTSRPPEDFAEPQLRRVFLMGTWLDFECSQACSSQLLAQTSDHGFEVIRELEAVWSTWRPDSVLNGLNRAPRGAWEASVLRSDLRRVLDLSEKLEGAFHPGLGLWILASRVREGRASAQALERFSRRHRIPRSPREDHWSWEEGGFAKGLALDRASEVLAAEHPALKAWTMDFGGQILHRGPKRRSIRIRSFHSNPAVKMPEFWIQNESVASSGQVERPGHLLDPFTGKMVADLGSVSVIHASALVADMVSTALAVFGPEKSESWWRRHRWDTEFQGLEWIWFERSGRVRMSSGMKGRLTEGGPSLIESHSQ
ncbi:MAG: hypothetical protein RJB38_2273 [Pseudomonadota bacterium]|jgi:thiamine biosynthesis lipoprotein ApbE